MSFSDQRSMFLERKFPCKYYFACKSFIYVLSFTYDISWETLSQKYFTEVIVKPLDLCITLNNFNVGRVTLHSLHCAKSIQIQIFFWSVFSCIRTEYGDLLCKSSYSVQIQENTDHKKLRIWTLFTQCRL